MDRERFDALARLLAAQGSRRGALGTLIGAALLGVGSEAEAKKNNRHHHKRHQKAQKRRRRRAQAAQTCFGTDGCAFPSDGKDFENCNFINFDFTESCDGCNFRRADLTDADFNDNPDASFQGVSFRAANLRGADLAFVDVSGASFRDACLVGADLFHAKIDGADFRGALFCNTVSPDGSINNSGCNDLNDCCPPCLAVGAACGEGIFGDCCDTQCVNGFCAPECSKDTDCDFGEFCCDQVCVARCCNDKQCEFGLCIDGICAECLKDTDCGPERICCDNFCVFGECCFDFQCEPFGNQCKHFECECGDRDACDEDETCCEDPEGEFECVDLLNDNENCGGCNFACFEDEECINGSCLIPCVKKETDCPPNNICVNGFCEPLS
jgi:hypothetical protein